MNGDTGKTMPDREISFSERVPEGDNVMRDVCDTCGFVHYVNPKIVVGSIVREGDKILLCRRAIEPRKGYWTLPAGYMEKGETTEEGAKREAHEEALAHIRIHDLLAVYNIPRISQVQLMYRASLTVPGVSAGPESLEVGFFAWDEIPWEDLAFPSVHWALHHYRSVWDETRFVPFGNPPGELGNRMPPVKKA